MTPPHQPPPPAVCVVDASVLIDLQNGGVLAACMTLPYRLAIPDAVHAAELGAPLRAAVRDLGLQIVGLAGGSVAELALLRPQHPELSVPDLFALFAARDLKAIPLTGDHRLKSLAESRGLEVHGTLWLLDALYERQTLGPAAALAALEAMLARGAWLPDAECAARQQRWRAAIGAAPAPCPPC
jgi:predicted nucleic acid-binding protein